MRHYRHALCRLRLQLLLLLLLLLPNASVS
jgi:hypothetical protein